jgi:hypothetical protein
MASGGSGGPTGAGCQSAGWVQVPVWQARRTARLAELGFTDLAGYLNRRYFEHGWSPSWHGLASRR